MRFVVLSDTHNRHEHIHVPSGDVLLHLGDASYRGNRKHIRSFAKWFSALPHEHKFIIPGNHDRCRRILSAIDLKKEYKDIERCTLLWDTSVVVEGVHIHGTSWESSTEHDFTAWDGIDIDILMTHIGPYKIRSHGGSRPLLREVLVRQIPVHLFGHFHYGRGVEQHQTTVFINCASSGNDGSMAPPVVFDYDPAMRRVTALDLGGSKDA
eukprot:gnl/Dysnectes_brevis/6654_a10493_423.p1 GENE.gnl/Dysnectes_brevis/6654_a10493_423~~gnl/Dysnectes_brevis/6654_a10493_423.p1  ORF type:complete len:220 (-),score=19.01 gnl/Dysnectes_brevis/6654_a10493_423:174-803(-)